MKTVVGYLSTALLILTLGAWLEKRQEAEIKEEGTAAKQIVTDPNAATITPPPQALPRYSPNFIKYADENIIKIDEFLLDEEGNVKRWCAIAVYNREKAELVHCLK